MRGERDIFITNCNFVFTERKGEKRDNSRVKANFNWLNMYFILRDTEKCLNDCPAVEV